MARLAIIGTAGRGDDGKRLASDPERYLDAMMRAACKVVEETGATQLVSGGAAFSDHIAVLLFLEDAVKYSLELELPAKLVPHQMGLCFDDKGTRDFKGNAGGVSNHYHRLFRKAFSKTRPAWSPFLDFQHANQLATINVGTGFLERNLVVAGKADHCLAMTFGDKHTLKDGGTAHTMSNFLKRGVGTSWHLDLNTLKLYKGAITG